jgi:hypothetical protein
MCNDASTLGSFVVNSGPQTDSHGAIERTAGSMTQRRATLSVSTVKFAIAGVAAAGAVLAPAAPALADPAAPTPTPGPSDPAAAAPGQIVVSNDGPEAPPAAPPVGPPTVPEIANPVYGSGQYGSGPIGSLRDLWHQARDPYAFQEPDVAGGVAPPPGAGPAPKLPPGYVSINAPGSETPVTAPAPGSAPAGPALPPGYYPLNGPPPPGYQFNNSPGGQPAAPADPAPPAPAP